MIETITVEGFLSIRSASVELGNLNLLIGANGSGKSNFVSALELLGRIVDEDLALYVGRRGGAAALLHRGTEPTDKIVLDLEFPPNGYRAALVSAAGDEVVFAEEQIRFQGTDYPAPWIDRLGSGQRETRLNQHLTQGQAVAAYVVHVLRGCRVFHFHDTSAGAPVKRRADVANNRGLAADALNLAPFLRRIRDDHPADYERIRSVVRQVAPFFRDFVLEEEQQTMRLRWRHVEAAVAQAVGSSRFRPHLVLHETEAWVLAARQPRRRAPRDAAARRPARRGRRVRGRAGAGG